MTVKFNPNSSILDRILNIDTLTDCYYFITHDKYLCKQFTILRDTIRTFDVNI